MPAASCRRRSASRARCCRGSRTRRRGRSSSTNCSCRRPRTGWGGGGAWANVLGDEVYPKMRRAGGTKPMATDLTELILNRTWRPQLAVTAMDGYPLPENGGNVLLPSPPAKLSVRLPPTCDAVKATVALKSKLEADAPYGAEVEFDADDGQT